jgi:hypothetical protein
MKHFTAWQVLQFSLILVASCLIFGQTLLAGDLVLHPKLTRELNQLLRVSESLHKALVSQDEEKTEIAIRDILQQIDAVRYLSQHTELIKFFERGHLLRILTTARENFELTIRTYGDERRGRVEDGFNQLVNLVRIYRLQSDFGIYFCERDRTSWVQKGGRAQNPFRPESMRDCGIRAAH